MTDLFTLEQLIEINNNLNTDKCKIYNYALNSCLNKYNINTRLRICHFLAQVLHESGHLKYNSENLNYSAKALRSVFGKYFKTNEMANEYARKPEKIANLVYANRMGNGDENSGDGWKYRGRGLIQLTGKNNYKSFSDDYGLNVIEFPDLVSTDITTCVLSACWFWNKNNLNKYADENNILSITKKINGGTNGLEDRQNIFNLAMSIL